MNTCECRVDVWTRCFGKRSLRRRPSSVHVLTVLVCFSFLSFLHSCSLRIHSDIRRRTIATQLFTQHTVTRSFHPCFPSCPKTVGTFLLQYSEDGHLRTSSHSISAAGKNPPSLLYVCIRRCLSQIVVRFNSCDPLPNFSVPLPLLK